MDRRDITATSLVARIRVSAISPSIFEAELVRNRAERERKKPDNFRVTHNGDDSSWLWCSRVVIS